MCSSVQPYKTKFNCLQCRMAKVKCSRAVPCCERCTRLQLTCHPQFEKNSRVSTSRMREMAPPHGPPRGHPPPAAPSLASTHSDASDSSSCHGSMQGGQRLVPPNNSCRGVAWDYRQCASLMVSAIGGLKARGELHDGRTMSLLRSWAFVNRRHKDDLTWGAYDQILELMGPYATTTFPLEAADLNVHPSHALCDEQGSYLNTACLPPYLTSLYDDSCVSTGFIRHDGVCRLFSNPRFSSTFMCMEEMTSCPHASIPEFLLSRILHPSERQEFFERLVELLVSRPKANAEMAAVLLCQERGSIEPVQSLVRVRYVTVEGGMYSSAIMSIRRLSQPNPNPTTCPNEDIARVMGGGGLPAQPHPMALATPLAFASPPADLCPVAASKAMSSFSSFQPIMPLPYQPEQINYNQGDAWVMQLIADDGLDAPSSTDTTTTFNSSSSSDYAHPLQSTASNSMAWNNTGPSVPHEGPGAMSSGGGGHLPGGSMGGGWGELSYNHG